jgi:hypothetical protein
MVTAKFLKDLFAQGAQNLSTCTAEPYYEMIAGHGSGLPIVPFGFYIWFRTWPTAKYG